MCFGSTLAGSAVLKEDMGRVVVQAARAAREATTEERRDNRGAGHSRCSRGRTCSRRRWSLARRHHRCRPRGMRTRLGKSQAASTGSAAARGCRAWPIRPSLGTNVPLRSPVLASILPPPCHRMVPARGRNLARQFALSDPPATLLLTVVVLATLEWLPYSFRL